MQPWFREFTDAIEDGEPVYRQCKECAGTGLPPREVCPECTGGMVERPLSGPATVVSHTLITSSIPAFAEETPYTIVLAEFEEGVTLTGQLRDAKEVEIGDTVEVGVEAVGEEHTIVTFAPTTD